MDLLAWCLAPQACRELDAAGLRVYERCVRSSLGPRSFLAPSGDRAVDEAGVLTEQLVGAEAATSQHPRSEVLEEDIGHQRHAPYERRPIGVAEVDCDAAFSGVDVGQSFVPNA